MLLYKRSNIYCLSFAIYNNLLIILIILISTIVSQCTQRVVPFSANFSYFTILFEKQI